MRVVSDNELVELNDELVKLAMTEDESVVLRNAAGRRSLTLVPPNVDTPLRALADREEGLPDEDDSLLGVGLHAHLKSGTSPSELLHYLKEPADPDVYGSYWSFTTIELPTAMAADALTNIEVRKAVQWASRLDQHERPGTRQAGARPLCPEALQDAIVRAGLLRCADAEVRGDVAVLIRLCLTEDSRKLFQGSQKTLPELPVEIRRALVLQVIGEDDNVVLAWALVRSNLVQPDDLPWVVQLLDGRIASQPHTMRTWLLSSLDRSRADHQEAVKAIDSTSSAHRWLNPAPEPKELPDEAELVEAGPAPTKQQIHDRLLETLALKPSEAFEKFCFWAHFEADKTVAHPGLEIDVRNLPGWGYLSAGQHRQVLDAAVRYLHDGVDNGESLVGTDKVSNAGLAGVRAFALIAEEGDIVDLPVERWEFWAPALIHTPRNNGDDLLLSSLRRAVQFAGETVRAAVKREMQAAPEFAQFVLDRLMPALDAAAIEWLTALADDPALTDAAATVAFAQLIALDPVRGLSRISGDNEPTSRFRSFAVTALQVVGSRAWYEMRDRLHHNSDLATAILGDLAASHAFDTDNFAEDDLTAMWELMVEHFPPDEDPKVPGVHWVETRETIGRERDRVLPALAQRGTSEAVTALTDLAGRRPNLKFLRRLIARARAVMALAEWQPLLPDEIRAALVPARRVLRNEAHLLSIVVEALQDFEKNVLQGMTPLSTLLWNHGNCRASPPTCRPKSEDEISDLVDRHISAYLPGIVVNREVSIRRLKPSGLGQRADLLVQANTTGATKRMLRVIIEAKGCWNDEVPHALETQLVGQYLNPTDNAAGLFLIAWFDPDHGFHSGTWKRDPKRGNRDALLANIQARAVAAADETGRSIQALIINCSMPTKEVQGVKLIEAISLT